MQNARSMEGNPSPGLVPRFLRFTAFALVPGVYYLIDVNSVLWLWFLPMGLVAGRWFFPLLFAGGVLVIAVMQWLPLTPTECFVCGQAAVVLILLPCGAFVRTPEKGSLRAWLLLKTGRGVRLLFIVTAIILLIRWAMFRWTSPITNIGWAFTLLAFTWKAPWPEPAMRTTWKDVAANATLVLVSTIAGLAILEVAARALYEDPNIRPPGEGIYEYHEEALFTLRPDHVGRYTARDRDGATREFEVRISSQGLRERELGPKKAGEFRILALGDSFTIGWGVSHAEAYPHVLEELLDSEHLNMDVTVVNAGVSGYGPWQEAIFLEERCWDLEPDLVLLQLYPENDIGNTLTKIRERLPTYNPGWERRVVFWRYYDDWRVQAEWRLLAYSRLYYAVTQVANVQIDWDRFFRSIRFLGPARREVLEPGAPRPFYLEIMLRDWYPQLYAGWTMLRDDVERMRDRCRARGVPFVVFSLPTMQECVDEQWAEAMAAETPKYTYERYKDVQVANVFFGEAGLTHIDVPSAIIAHADPSRLYLRDGHLSPAGHGVVAQRLAQELVSRILPQYGVHPDEAVSK